MKTSFEQGGPAFPQALLNDEGEVYYFHDWRGMSLRDYFAAKALHSMQSLSIETEDGLPEQMAKWAYAVADAMLKARDL